MQYLLEAKDDDVDNVDYISNMAMAVAPHDAETPVVVKEEKEAFANRHHNLFQSLLAGNMFRSAAAEAAALTEGLLRLFHLRHKRFTKERFGEWLVASLDAGGGEVRRFLKGGQQPDTT